VRPDHLIDGAIPFFDKSAAEEDGRVEDNLSLLVKSEGSGNRRAPG